MVKHNPIKSLVPQEQTMTVSGYNIDTLNNHGNSVSKSMN